MRLHEIDWIKKINMKVIVRQGSKWIRAEIPEEDPENFANILAQPAELKLLILKRM